MCAPRTPLGTLRELETSLVKLKAEVGFIWKEELVLKVREKLGENVRNELSRLAGREEKCFREIRAARKTLREMCGHPNIKWVGRDWFCRDCGKIGYSSGQPAMLAQ